jgi:hypothetical protein
MAAMDSWGLGVPEFCRGGELRLLKTTRQGRWMEG